MAQIFHKICRISCGRSVLFLSFILQFSILHSQVYPVHVATQLLPPYSVYLADYAAPGCEQLRLVLLQRDLSQPVYQTFLRMSIEWNGREIIRSMPSYRPAPLTVSPGVPTIISGSDLYHYLDPQNMDFTGYSRETYTRSKSLPEGQYRITFTAYDYARPEVAVSMPGSAFLYLAKAEPPLLNMPPDRYIQSAMPVQNVLFSWLPRNISSPNSANSTEYLLELFEIRPAGYNPNEIVKNTRPIFSTQITRTQYMYGIADPVLIAGMQYAWRVRAVDTQGRDAMRNGGYSEVFTFTYGDTGGNGNSTENSSIGSNTVMPAVAGGFKVEAAAPRRAKAAWQASAAADGYKLTYRLTTPPTGSQNITPDNEWKELETTKSSLDVNGLIPGAGYEARLQSRLGTRWGGYSDLVSFTMPALQEIRCGDPYTHPELHREPLEKLTPYSEINAGGFPVTVLEATGSNGRFSGRGYAQVPMLGYVKLQVEFSNIFVNSDYYLVDGSINVITDWENNVIANADVIAEGGRNTGRVNEGVEQTDIVTDYEIAGADSIYKDRNGNIVAVDMEGNMHVLIANTNPQSTNDITKNSSKENNNNQNHVAIATEYGFHGSQTIQVGNSNSQNVSEDTKNRILREVVESIKSKIDINTFSGTDRQYIEGAIINTEFILNSTSFRLERNGMANGWYENGQLHIYIGVETEDDIKSTIFHEYLHHVNYLLQVFPYRYSNKAKRYIYEKEDDCFYFGKKSMTEIYEDFTHANAVKIMQECWSNEYSQLKEEQKEKILRYKEEQKDKYERETCMRGKYRPSNYYRDEISIYRIILKLNGILFNLSDSKRNTYLSNLSEYENTILPRSVAYENRNNINNNGDEK